MTIKSKKVKRKKFQPFEPDSNFKTSWDLTGLFLILYEAIVIPYRVAFNMQSMGLFAFLEYFIDVFFITDVCKSKFPLSHIIVVNFYTGYYKKGALIMKRRHIMCRYLRTWFIVDFISSFPYTWVINFDQYYDENGNIKKSDIVVHHTSQLLRLLKIIRFVRIIRLIRLFKLRRLVNKVR